MAAVHCTYILVLFCEIKLVKKKLLKKKKTCDKYLMSSGHNYSSTC